MKSEKRGEGDENEGCYSEDANGARPFSGGACRAHDGDAAGGVTLGNGGDDSEYRDAEAPLEGVQCLHQHASRLATETDLSMLWNAAGGCHHQS